MRMKFHSFRQTDGILTFNVFIVVNHNHPRQMKGHSNKTSNFNKQWLVSWITSSCGVAGGYQGFGETYSLNLQDGHSCREHWGGMLHRTSRTYYTIRRPIFRRNTLPTFSGYKLELWKWKKYIHGRENSKPHNTTLHYSVLYLQWHSMSQLRLQRRYFWIILSSLF
jgi:hypothetical protein